MAFIRKYIEQIAWTIALFLLFKMDVSEESTSFCLFKILGFKSCWGCGIGHSIHYALHLQFQQSIHAHLLGIPATLAITYIIFNPILFKQKQTNLLWTSNIGS